MRGFLAGFAIFGIAVMILSISSGCGSTRMQVLQASALPRAQDSVQLVALPLQHKSPFMEAVAESFDRKLRHYLYDGTGLKDGAGIRIEYRFFQIDPGDRTLRFLIGFGAGKGSVTLGVTYFDASGEEIAKIQVESEVTDGLTGGSFEDRVDKAARIVADYTLHQVLGRTTPGARGQP